MHSTLRSGATLVILFTLGGMAACGGDPDSASSDTTDAADALALDTLTFQSGGACSHCAKDNDCGPGLTCDKPVFVCKTPAQVKAGAPVCALDCEESKACTESGLCGLLEGACVARTFAHCFASQACKDLGKCTAAAGGCAVGGDSDCQKSAVCSKDGKCKADKGACVPSGAVVTCGDGACDPGETKQSCPKDCGPVGGQPCPCAAGACGTLQGCPNDCGGCDAGEACFTNQCKVAACQLPAAFTGGLQRVTKLELLPKKMGCDYDDSGTANNTLGKLFSVYPFVNDGASVAIAMGKLNILLHAEAFNDGGTPFGVSFLRADLPDGPSKCDLTATDVASSCAFIARAGSFDGAAKSAVCPAVSGIDGVTAQSGKLKTSGSKGELELLVYVVGVPLKLPVTMARITGTLTGGSTWKTTTSGQICGAITTANVAAAVDSINDSALEGTGFDKAAIKKLVADLFSPDLDTDGDNKPDAISGAWAFETLPVKVSGVK